jgi:hypothetical protein
MSDDEIKKLSETAYIRYRNKADDVKQHVNNLIATYKNMYV